MERGPHSYGFFLSNGPSFTVPDNLTLVSGQDVELLLTFQNAPTQDFDLLLRLERMKMATDALGPDSV